MMKSLFPYHKCYLFFLIMSLSTNFTLMSLSAIACPSVLLDPMFREKLFEKIRAGGIVMVLRHMERGNSEFNCPKESAELSHGLSKFDGLTRQGRWQSNWIKKGLTSIPHSNWEIISSGQCRARQTANFIFPGINVKWEKKLETINYGGDPDWLKDSILSFKSHTSNLALITHSDMIETLEIQNLKMQSGIGLFLDPLRGKSSWLLGCFLPNDWRMVNSNVLNTK